LYGYFNGSYDYNQSYRSQIDWKKHIVKTFSSEIFKYVWSACCLSIIILFLLSLTTSGFVDPSFFVNCASILVIGYLVTGAVNDLKFMKVLALFWWFTAIVFHHNYLGVDLKQKQLMFMRQPNMLLILTFDSDLNEYESNFEDFERIQNSIIKL